MLKRNTLSHCGLVLLVTAVSAVLADDGKDDSAKKKGVGAVLDFTVQNIDGDYVRLADYQGDVLMVVNVASKCGYTPQYEQLETLYRKYRDEGFKVLAFPANNFGKQEPGTNREIKEFCRTRYNASFDLFSKVSVKGDDIVDFYAFLIDKNKTGEHGGEIRWNFEKFIIDRSGEVIARFESRVSPTDPKVIEIVEKALSKKKKSSKTAQ